MHVNRLHARDTCMSRALMPCLFQALYECCLRAVHILASGNRLADLLSCILASLELCFSLSHSGTNQPHLTMKSRTRLDIAAVVLFSSFRRQGSLHLPGRPMQLKTLSVRHFNLLPPVFPITQEKVTLKDSLHQSWKVILQLFCSTFGFTATHPSHSQPSILHT